MTSHRTEPAVIPRATEAIVTYKKPPTVGASDGETVSQMRTVSEKKLTPINVTNPGNRYAITKPKLLEKTSFTVESQRSAEAPPAQ